MRSLRFHVPPLWVLYGVVFLDLIAVGLVVPLLPYYATRLGADAVIFGYLGSTYGFMQLLGSTLMGRLGDKWGRKRVLLLSLFGTGFSYFLLGIANSLALLFISRIPVGLFKQTISVTYAYVADLTVEGERARQMGYVGVMVGIGWIIGPGLGGALSSWSYSLPCAVSVSVIALNFLMVYIFLDEPRVKRVIAVDEEALEVQPGSDVDTPTTSPRWYSGFITAVQSPVLVLLLTVSFFTTLAVNSFESTFSLMMQQEFWLSMRQNGLVLSYSGFLSVAVQGTAVGYFAKWLPERRLIQVTTAGIALSLTACAMAQSLWLVLAVMAPLALFSGVLRTCLLSSLTKAAPPNSIGTIIGVQGSLESVCRAVAPGIGGVLLQYSGGHRGPGMFGSAVVGILSLCMFAMAPSETRQKVSVSSVSIAPLPFGVPSGLVPFAQVPSRTFEEGEAAIASP